MKIDTIAEHSVCLELLPENANLLDAGCRDMKFTNYFRELNHKVLAIDIDIDDLPEGVLYKKIGLSTNFGKGYVQKDSNDKQATKLVYTDFNCYPHSKSLASNEVLVYSLEALEKMAGGKFDLIKLDIEGEELPVLTTAKHPIARQVSVEFHIHCGQKLEDVNALLLMLGKYYDIHGAVLEDRHGAGLNYWNVLLISK